MGRPLWREPTKDDATRRLTTRSPTHPVIARSPITRARPAAPATSSRRGSPITRRRLPDSYYEALREIDAQREMALAHVDLPLSDDEFGGPPSRLTRFRAIYNLPEPNYESDVLRDALHAYTPTTQDVRALDQVVSLLTDREPLRARDSPEAQDREQLGERTSSRSMSSEQLDSGDNDGISQPQERRGHTLLSDRIRRAPERSSLRWPYNRRAVSTLDHARRRVNRNRRRLNRNVDGLGDRDRSLSPEGDGLWDNLLTTLTPDPQPPSVGSSFASTTASTSTSQNPTVSSSRTSITSSREAAEPAEPPCDPVSDLEGLAERDWDRQDWLNSIQSDTEVLEANPTSSSNDLAFISSMHAIIRRLASREDIPDEWWERAGLNRSMSWEGDN